MWISHGLQYRNIKKGETIYSTIDYIQQLFAEDEVNIVVNIFLGDYSTILTEPEVNNCFSIYTRSDLSRIGKETIEKNDYFD